MRSCWTSSELIVQVSSDYLTHLATQRTGFAAKVCRAMRALIRLYQDNARAREEGGYLAVIPIHGSIMSLSSSIQLFAVPPRAARYTLNTPPTRHRLAVRHRGAASSAKTVPRNRLRS